jgi:hypothetical protein
MWDSDLYPLIEAYKDWKHCQHEPVCYDYLAHWLRSRVQKNCPHDPKCPTWQQCAHLTER